MANYERGVYEPSDEVRVFDASEDEEDVEGSRLPLLIVLALVVLAMFAGVVYVAYTQGVAKGRGETPVLAAANGPARIAPQQPGGTDVPYQGFKVYEQPAPPDDAADMPGATPPAGPAPAATAPAGATGSGDTGQASHSAPVAAAPPAAKPDIAAVKPAPVKAAPVKVAPVLTAKPEERAVAPPLDAKPRTSVVSVSPPPAKPQIASAAPPVAVGPATGAPRQLGAPATPAAELPTPKPVAAKPAAGGGYVLQIGAYKSRADAETAWKAYKGRHAALLSGYSDDVQEADLGDKGVWYRLRIAGFGDRDVASGVCDRLKADGGSCFPGK